MAFVLGNVFSKLLYLLKGKKFHKKVSVYVGKNKSLGSTFAENFSFLFELFHVVNTVFAMNREQV